MRCRFLLVLAALVGCDGAMDGGAAAEPPGLVGTTQAHNTIRANHGVAPLAWDPRLATIAQTWADMCQDADGNGLIDHDANRSNGYPTYVGENVYGSSGAATGTDAVAAWAAEESSYDYASNTCNGVCGHYTQIVWAATMYVGCGISSCPNLRYSNSVVCDYGPGGNDGGRPY